MALAVDTEAAVLYDVISELACSSMSERGRRLTVFEGIIMDIDA